MSILFVRSDLLDKEEMPEFKSTLFEYKEKEVLGSERQNQKGFYYVSDIFIEMETRMKLKI